MISNMAVRVSPAAVSRARTNVFSSHPHQVSRTTYAIPSSDHCRYSSFHADGPPALTLF